MDTEAMQSPTRVMAARGLVDWATVGLPSTLAGSVGAKMMAIANTGVPQADEMEWVLFGEVTGTCAGPPFTAHLRRLPMLVNKPEDQIGRWDTWDLVCPVSHDRVDFSIGMQIGVLTKPFDRQAFGKVVASQSVPVWNLPSFH